MDIDIIQSDVSIALQEDVGAGDVTAALIAEDQMVKAELISRESAILCGKAWFDEVYKQLDPRIELEWLKSDGDTLTPNHVFLRLQGPARALLTGERTAMNWLQSLSATATLTSEFVQAMAGRNCKLLDTRKTLPCLRYAQKYAVRCGGGTNHRFGLYDAYLIKENHIASCGSIDAAVKKARELNPTMVLEVEVENLNELEQALLAGADIVMLDNFSIKDMCRAVQMNTGPTKLEVSGNVDIDSVRDIADTGVDFISVGALTKNVIAIDLSMRVVANV
jgi:nicotinate-nucleotide pyrophosphorylase (carboxylating)